MANEGHCSIFEEPQCIIEADKHGNLTYHQDVLNQMKSLDKKMVVVTIVGLYRTGKSYLMNRLAGKSAGFALGSTIQSKTKGIWIWVRHHPEMADTYILLMDTEGLGDAEKGDSNYDNWIFTLSTLLSTVLVYNYLGVINNDMITKLNFVAEISKRIKTRLCDEEGQDNDFDLHFPVFVMALRDFCLDLEIDGQEVTADQYLEHLLILGKSKNSKFIQSRKCIRKYFKTRKCFTFDRPTPILKKLKHLEDVKEEELNALFLEQTEEFTDYIFHEGPTMKLPSGSKVTGRMFAYLVELYVGAIQKGELPVVEDAYVMMAQQENSLAVKAAIGHYGDQMKAMVTIPTENDQELSDIHMHLQKQAIEYFASKAISDLDGTFQKSLNEELFKIYQSYQRENWRASEERCKDVLSDLAADIKQKLEDGQYTRAGGYEDYTADLGELMEAYRARTGLGVAKERTIDEYIKGTADTSASILAADQKMSEGEKKVEELKQEAAHMELERKRNEEKIRQQQKETEENIAAMAVTMEEMEKKHAEEVEEMTNQQKDMEERRIKEQERLLKEGFKKEAEKMKSEMEQSQQQFMEEQKLFQEVRENEKHLQEEMMKAKLREQEMRHEHNLQLQKEYAENERMKERLQYQEEAARKAKEDHEAIVEKLTEMSLNNASAMERMQQENIKAQLEMQQKQQQLEMKKLEDEMERDRLNAKRQEEERERQEEREHKLQERLLRDKADRDKMMQTMMQENAKSLAAIANRPHCVIS